MSASTALPASANASAEACADAHDAVHQASPDEAARRLALRQPCTGEGIFSIDMDGRCTVVNRAACATLPRTTPCATA